MVSSENTVIALLIFHPVMNALRSKEIKLYYPYHQVNTGQYRCALFVLTIPAVKPHSRFKYPNKCGSRITVYRPCSAWRDLSVAARQQSTVHIPSQRQATPLSHGASRHISIQHETTRKSSVCDSCQEEFLPPRRGDEFACKILPVGAR